MKNWLERKAKRTNLTNQEKQKEKEEKKVR